MINVKSLAYCYYKSKLENTIHGYSLSIDDCPCSDNYMSEQLGMLKEDYINLLLNCNAYIAEDESCLFKNEDDAEKAVIMLKLMI